VRNNPLPFLFPKGRPKRLARPRRSARVFPRVPRHGTIVLDRDKPIPRTKKTGRPHPLGDATHRTPALSRTASVLQGAPRGKVLENSSADRSGMEEKPVERKGRHVVGRRRQQQRSLRASRPNRPRRGPPPSGWPPRRARRKSFSPGRGLQTPTQGRARENSGTATPENAPPRRKKLRDDQEANHRSRAPGKRGGVCIGPGAPPPPPKV